MIITIKKDNSIFRFSGTKENIKNLFTEPFLTTNYTSLEDLTIGGTYKELLAFFEVIEEEELIPF